ncbi:MAG: hypothetical protein ACM3PV_05845 [Betaproteobacteria bacterium]
MRGAWLALGLGLCALAAAPAAPAAAQDPDWAIQRFEMTPEPARATLGDSITVRFRIHLTERDLLSDSVPRPVAALPEGVRVLEVAPLRKAGTRALDGRARLAFYRVGRRAIPAFGVPFVRIVSGQRGVLVSDSAFVDIDSVAPPGNPSLKDIKDIERQHGPDPRLVAGMAAAALLGGLVVQRRRARRRTGPPAPLEPAGAEAVVLGPYEAALARLTQIERERWPVRREVDRHYAAVADVLRRYLEEAHAIPALERTTTELAWALPPALAEGGLRERCAALLADADLVKFARCRPEEADAARLLRAARDLLGAWRAAARAAAPESDHALR